MVARLLGHRDVRMTLRYAHVGDHDIEAAAEPVETVAVELLAGNANPGYPPESSD